MGQLGKAEESVKNANIRAVRGAAVEIILSDEKGTYLKDKDGKEVTTWYATALVTSNGDIQNLKIATDTASVDSDYPQLNGSTGVAEKKNGSYKVKVKITDLTVAGS